MHILLKNLDDGGRELDIDMPNGKGLIRVDSSGRPYHFQFRPLDPELNPPTRSIIPNPMPDGMKATADKKALTCAEKAQSPKQIEPPKPYQPRFELPGDKLARAFENAGIQKKEGCSCQGHQNQMNALWIDLEKENPDATLKQLSMMYVNKYGMTIASWLAAEAVRQRVIVSPNKLLKITKEVMGIDTKTSMFGIISPKRIWKKMFGKPSSIPSESEQIPTLDDVNKVDKDQ
jgi:hypothetical protein